MLSRRPLLYLSIPSLALLIGLVWFRRKKAIQNCDTGGSGVKRSSSLSLGTGVNCDLRNSSRSSAVNINSPEEEKETLNNSNSSSGSGISNRSAPIDIHPNSRSPPIPINNKNKNLDFNELNSKIRDQEYRTLNSIDESESSVDLPGSYERRNFEFARNKCYYKKNKKNMADQPVIITASKSPKISPKNAFLEANTSSTESAASSRICSDDDNNNSTVGEKSVVKTVINDNKAPVAAPTKASDLKESTAIVEQPTMNGKVVGDDKQNQQKKLSQQEKGSNNKNTNLNNKNTNVNNKNINKNVNKNSRNLNNSVVVVETNSNVKNTTNGSGQDQPDSGKKQQQQQKKEEKKVEKEVVVVEEKKVVETSVVNVNSNPDNDSNNNKKTSSSVVEESNKTAEATAAPPTVSSPPLSLYSVNSSDSGKGSSPPHSEAAVPPTSCYEFLINEKYVGLIIGRNGTYVKRLSRKFGVRTSVIKHPLNRPNERTCAMEGPAAGIDAALDFIRQKIAKDRIPSVSLERVYYSTTPTSTTIFKSSQKRSNPLKYPCPKQPISLSLVEGINNVVMISTIVNAGHVFLQQPSHPTFQQLRYLHANMTENYNTEDSPALPKLEEDFICVAPVQGSWYRVVIVSHDPQSKMCVVKFLDYGGFTSVLSTDLRQIRGDFLELPFQSIECVLSNLRPVGEAWPQTASDALYGLTNGLVLEAQVAGYTEDNVPEVLLFAILGPGNVVFINQELVAEGHAVWVEDDVEEEVVGGELAVQMAEELTVQ